MGEYCIFHNEALSRLKEHFEVWKGRKGLTWEEYLREVASNNMTGEWVREVAKYLLRGTR